MQTIELYGLFVECSEQQNNFYMDVKSQLETGIKSLHQKLKDIVLSNELYHYIQLSNTKLFTIYIDTNGVIQFGLYDKKKQKIYQHCDFSEIAILSQQDGQRIEQFFLRIENTIRINRDTVRSSLLYNAWQEILYEQKKENELEDDLER